MGSAAVLSLRYQCLFQACVGSIANTRLSEGTYYRSDTFKLDPLRFLSDYNRRNTGIIEHRNPGNSGKVRAMLRRVYDPKHSCQSWSPCCQQNWALAPTENIAAPTLAIKSEWISQITDAPPPNQGDKQQKPPNPSTPKEDTTPRSRKKKKVLI